MVLQRPPHTLPAAPAPAKYSATLPSGCAKSVAIVRCVTGAGLESGGRPGRRRRPRAAARSSPPTTRQTWKARAGEGAGAAQIGRVRRAARTSLALAHRATSAALLGRSIALRREQATGHARRATLTSLATRRRASGAAWAAQRWLEVRPADRGARPLLRQPSHRRSPCLRPRSRTSC